jgi:hypothetical protein
LRLRLDRRCDRERACCDDAEVGIVTPGASTHGDGPALCRLQRIPWLAPPSKSFASTVAQTSSKGRGLGIIF